MLGDLFVLVRSVLELFINDRFVVCFGVVDRCSVLMYLVNPSMRFSK